MIAFFAQMHSKKVGKVIKYLLLYRKRNIIYFLPTFFYKFTHLAYISSVRILKTIFGASHFEALVANRVWPAARNKGNLRDKNCLKIKKLNVFLKKVSQVCSL